MFKDIRSQYGQAYVKEVRKLENITRKISRHKNHLIFTLRCKDIGFTPPSLNIKCPIQTLRAKKIIERAKHGLVKERIRTINNKLDTYNKEKDTLENTLYSKVGDSLQRDIKQHIEWTRESTHQRIKQHHQDKFERLTSKAKNKEIDLSGTQLKRWVVNLSKYELSDSQSQVLAKGLNFAVTPKTVPIDEYIVATEQASWFLPEDKRTELRSEVNGVLKNARVPKSNLNKEQAKAIAILKGEKSIKILAADKGRATVVMDTSDYEEKNEDYVK